MALASNNDEYVIEAEGYLCFKNGKTLNFKIQSVYDEVQQTAVAYGIKATGEKEKLIGVNLATLPDQFNQLVNDNLNVTPEHVALFSIQGLALCKCLAHLYEHIQAGQLNLRWQSYGVMIIFQHGFEFNQDVEEAITTKIVDVLVDIAEGRINKKLQKIAKKLFIKCFDTGNPSVATSIITMIMLCVWQPIRLLIKAFYTLIKFLFF